MRPGLFPGEPAPWKWVKVTPEAVAKGVVRAAERPLSKRADGTAADGEGATLMLFVSKAPEGRTLAEVAASDAVRGGFLKRFRGTHRT